MTDQQQTFSVLQALISCSCIWEGLAGISCGYKYKREAEMPQILSMH